MHPVIRALPLLAALASASGCASLNKKESGAIIGATTGAAVGGVVGNATGSTARGAIVGAIVGGAAGAVIGHQMDQQAKKIKDEIPGAVVERVGEGLQVTLASGLLFDFDSDVLRAEARSNLATFAKNLDQYPGTDVLIVGHTDNTGSNEYNASLATRRAAAAEKYLISQGVTATRLRSVGKGEMEPIATNETEAGRQANRRVEIAIYANEALKAQASRPVGK